jgi:hypothetical protein
MGSPRGQRRRLGPTTGSLRRRTQDAGYLRRRTQDAIGARLRLPRGCVLFPQGCQNFVTKRWQAHLQDTIVVETHRYELSLSPRLYHVLVFRVVLAALHRSAFLFFLFPPSLRFSLRCSFAAQFKPHSFLASYSVCATRHRSAAAYLLFSCCLLVYS